MANISKIGTVSEGSKTPENQDSIFGKAATKIKASAQAAVLALSLTVPPTTLHAQEKNVVLASSEETQEADETVSISQIEQEIANVTEKMDAIDAKGDLTRSDKKEKFMLAKQRKLLTSLLVVFKKQETAREKAETAREKAETAKVNQELIEEKAETAREKAETAREKAETAKVNKELAEEKQKTAQSNQELAKQFREIQKIVDGET